MGQFVGQQAVCYKCNQMDKKGNLQMCLGWRLLKKIEEDANEFNRIQQEAQEMDRQREQDRQAAAAQEASTMDMSAGHAHDDPSSAHHEPSRPTGVLENVMGYLGQHHHHQQQQRMGQQEAADSQAAAGPSSAAQHMTSLITAPEGAAQLEAGAPQPAVDAAAAAGIQPPDAQAAAATEGEEGVPIDLRETQRFALFNKGTSLMSHAECPYQSGRHFHQTCLGRGAHLAMSRRILSWSGRSNTNKRKKAGSEAVRDQVKVTGRHALCEECLHAYAQEIGQDVQAMLPAESNPERRQGKVASRHRLAHASELPALGQLGNLAFCAYVSDAGRVKIVQTDGFGDLRNSNADIDQSCTTLEELLRKRAKEENTDSWRTLEELLRKRAKEENKEAAAAAAEARRKFRQGARTTSSGGISDGNDNVDIGSIPLSMSMDSSGGPTPPLQQQQQQLAAPQPLSVLPQQQGFAPQAPPVHPPLMQHQHQLQLQQQPAMHPQSLPPLHLQPQLPQQMQQQMAQPQ